MNGKDGFRYEMFEDSLMIYSRLYN